MWEIAVHLAAAGDVLDGVFLCCPFSHEMSWMRSGTELIHFLGAFLLTHTYLHAYSLFIFNHFNSKLILLNGLPRSKLLV